MLRNQLERIHILRFRDSYRVGGPEKTILETAAHTNNARFKFTIASFEEAGIENEFIAAAKELNISAMTIQNESIFKPHTVKYLANYIRSKNITIFHGHDYKTRFLGYWSARIAGVPKIATVHGWIQNSKKDMSYVLIDKILLRHYDKIIVVSKDLMNKVRKIGISEEKIVLLHNSIEIPRAGNNYSNSLRKDLRIGDNCKIVATVSRLSREKGVNDFITAASLVTKINRNIMFLIIGEGPEERVLRERVKNSRLANNLKFLGYQKCMESIYPEIDIIVLASYTEGLPKVIIEGLAFERPVIATNVGGVPEIILDNETGILIQPGRPSILAEKIQELINNEERRKCLGRNGKVLIEKYFNIKKRTEKLEQLYESVLRRSH